MNPHAMNVSLYQMKPRTHIHVKYFWQTYVKGIQAVRIDFFLFILKVAHIRCFMLIKCSEQEARFKKICYNVVISEKNSNVC
jgi:hypothetical protein